MRKLIPLDSKESQPTLDAVLAKIEHSNDLEVNEIIQAVIRRYKLVFPDWEVIFLSLPSQEKERKEVLEQTIEQLKKI